MPEKLDLEQRSLAKTTVLVSKSTKYKCNVMKHIISTFPGAEMKPANSEF